MITLEPLKRLLKELGAKRVSNDACRELSEYLEEEAITILKKAMKLAEHGGRKTIMKEDMRMVLREQD